MSIIRQKFTLKGSRGRKRVDILVDGAASECLIQPEIANKLGLPDKTPEPMSFDTSNQRDGLEAREAVMLYVCLNGQNHGAMFYMTEGLTEKAVIGARFLQAHDCRIDYKKKKLWIGKCCVEFRA